MHKFLEKEILVETLPGWTGKERKGTEKNKMLDIPKTQAKKQKNYSVTKHMPPHATIHGNGRMAQTAGP